MKDTKLFKIKDGKRFFKSVTITKEEDGQLMIVPTYCFKEEEAAWYVEDSANTYKEYFAKRNVELIFVKSIKLLGGGRSNETN